MSEVLIGQHDVRISHLEAEVKELKELIRSQDAKLDVLLGYFQRGQGIAWFLAKLGAFAAGLTSVIYTVYANWPAWLR